jgi:hypothetical protein
MTAATMSQTDLILPGDGYDEFVNFLTNVPSQPALLGSPRSVGGFPSAEPSDDENKPPPVVANMKGRDYNALIKQKSARKKQEDAAVPTRSLTKVVSSSSSPSNSKRQLGNGYTEKIKAKQQEKKEAEAALAAAESTKKRRASKEGSGGGSPKNGKPAVPRGPSLVFDDDETWNENYEALKKFQEEHGNCDVPFGKDTGALRSWTERQKKLYAHEKLDEERMGKMTYLGFQF